MRGCERHSTGRHAAIITGGVGLGILASRLLPPFLAQVSGMARAKLGQDPFQKLEKEHRIVQRILQKMVDTGDDSPGTRAMLLLTLKRALSKHAMAEEDVVYPLLHDMAGETEASKHLYAEHAEMKMHLYRLESELKTSGWRQQVSDLQDLIAGHIRDEEEVEFPKLRGLLDERRVACVSGKILREEALVL